MECLPVQNPSFVQEWNQRAGFVAAIAVINPMILTAYVLFWHSRGGGFEFWLIGMGLTFIVCLISGSFMLLVILADRRKRARDLRNKMMWEGVLPYNAAKAKADKAAEAG
jgi:L-asparagine transporter-like permease